MTWTNQALPLAEGIPTRTALLVTVGLIVAGWSVKAASNTGSLDAAAERFASLQQLARSALATCTKAPVQS